MFKKIGIENFRIFKNYTEFEIAPITVLTGPNNSGKSSFTKLIQLLSINLSKETGLVKLNFSSGNHNLGEFKNTLNWDTKSDRLKIVLDFPLDYFDEDFKIELVYKQYIEDGELETFRIFNDKRDLLNITEIDSEGIEIARRGQNHSAGNETISWSFKMDSQYIKKTISNLVKNSEPKSKLLFFSFLDTNKQRINSNVNFLYDIENFYFKHKAYVEYYALRNENYFLKIFNIEKSSTDPFLKKFTLDNIAYRAEYDIAWEYEYEFETFFKDEETLKKFKQLNLHSIKSSPEIENAFNEIITSNIYKAFKKLNEKFSFISFVTASRGSRDRILLNDSIFEINILMKEFSQFVKNEYSPYFSFLNDAFKILGIKGELKIKRIEGFGTLSYLKRNDKEILLSDLGYGYSQIIPILLKIVIESEKVSFYREEKFEEDEPINQYDELKVELKKTIYPTIVIEEPEANLHPNLQSKLADIFYLAYKTFNVHFIIESHSEYMIRKLQFLIASDKSELKTEDVAVYYFNDPEDIPKVQEQIYKLKIRDDGFMDNDFGKGFFDEATSLSFSLLNLKSFN